MVLDPIPQSLPVHFFGSRPQPPTSQNRSILRTRGWVETNLVGRERAFKHRNMSWNACILGGKIVYFRREVSLFSMETVSRGPSRISSPQTCAHRERETGCLEYMIVNTSDVELFFRRQSIFKGNSVARPVFVSGP